jgi:hypothetical protein
MAKRRARWRSDAAPGGAGERTPMTDGVSSGRRAEVAWWLGSNYGSGVQRPCARWRGTWKPTWRWARCGRRQQLGSGQSELEVGAVGASSALRRTEEKGKSARAPGKRKKGRREREGGVQPSDRAERTRGAAAARGQSSVRARRRGVGRCTSREKSRREREGEREVAVRWDRPNSGTHW